LAFIEIDPSWKGCGEMCYRPTSTVKKANICTKCHKVNPSDAKVCISCGNKLSGLPPLPGQSGGLEPTNQTNTEKE